MRKLKTTLAMLLILVTAFLCITPLTAFAATNTGDTNYSKYDKPETNGDYVYYNGSKTKKSGSTTKSEIRWIQAALNYCIKYEGLKTSYISVDGSFGPASKKATLAFQKAANLSQDGSFGPDTIKKMISVLNDGKKTFGSNASASATKNLKSICNVSKTYKIGNTKYYLATLKKGYNGIKKGETVFLNSNYTAVTDSSILEKLLFTNAVDALSKETNGFKDLTTNYYKVQELNNVCKKILDVQLIQKIAGSASGSFASVMISSSPKAIFATCDYLTEEAYMTVMTLVYLDMITDKALNNSNFVKRSCADGVSSYEEAKNIRDALVNARTAFLIAGTDCMYGLVKGYSNKKVATLNSINTYLNSMYNTLAKTYGGKIVNVIDKCSKGQDVISELNSIYRYDNCWRTAKNTFQMFDKYVNNSIKAVSSTQNKVAK